MKRKCKNVDISNVEFIEKAIEDCYSNKTGKVKRRADIKRLEDECNGDNHEIALLLSHEILERRIVVEPVTYDLRVDRSNEKQRFIAIEDFKMQLYDYIAYNALAELDSYIGHYQIACRKNMGPLFGAKVIQKWMREDDVRYVDKSDVRKCYPSIKQDNMMAWLRKHVANDALLWLISELMKISSQGIPTERLLKAISEDKELEEQYYFMMDGLPIGSYLSIKLCALYMADIYHKAEDGFYTERRGKRINSINHILINLDDIYIFGSNAKALNKAMRGLIEFASSKGLTIKSDWKCISLRHEDKNSHVDALGYRIYRDRITMRRRNYVKLKQSIRTFKHDRSIENARSLTARSGMFMKNINSVRFDKKYNAHFYLAKARKVISRYDKGKV